MVVEALIMFFSGIGVLFILIASVGIVRMPDFYLRLSVTVKASTLGIGFVLLSTVLYFGDLAVATKALAIVFFLFLTSPISAQLLGRISYFSGIPLWKKSVLDDLKGQYERKSEILSSEDQPPTEEENKNI